MRRFAFVSRHVPTPEQIALAEKADIELVHVGDRDGFTHDFSEFSELRAWCGVVVVHAAAAIRVMFSCRSCVGVFENGQRPDENGKPQFYPVALHLYWNTTCTGDAVMSMAETVAN